MLNACEFGCNETSKTCLLCTPSSNQCSGSDLQVCNTEGGAWNKVKTCKNGCTAGACDGECNTDDMRCSGKQPQICNGTHDGFVNTGDPCPIGCYQGHCKPNDCSTPTRCKSGNIETCDWDAGWLKSTTCQYGCGNVDGKATCKSCLTADFPKCSGNRLYSCTDEFQSPTYSTCPDGQWCKLKTCRPEWKVAANSPPGATNRSLAIVAAICWIEKYGGSNAFCHVLDTSSLDIAPTRSTLVNWFVDGKKDGSITVNTFAGVEGYTKEKLWEAALDIFGIGVINPENIDFKMTGGKLIEKGHMYCVHYNTTGGNEVFFDDCQGLSF